MARQPRLAVPGELHHLLLRGHNAQAVFADDADRAAFVELVRESAARNGVAVHAYALLADEVQLLATPATTHSLARLMQSIGARYVAAYNRRHTRRGTLWDGRFRSSILDAATLLIDAMVHIETLAVAAGLASSAQDWAWSSAAHHTGRRRDLLVTDHALYWQLGNTPFDRELAHAVLLSEAQQRSTDARFAEAVLGARVLGPPAFVAKIGATLSRPVVPRPRGRPRGRPGRQR
jgi:putative transposase